MFSAALHISRTLRRVPKFLPVAALAAACALLGAGQALSGGPSTSTATSLSVSATTIATGGSVTLTATVTGSAAAPTGAMVFTAKPATGSTITLGTVTVTQLNATQSRAWLATSPFTTAGSYSIVASYQSNTKTFSNSQSAAVTLTVGSGGNHK